MPSGAGPTQLAVIRYRVGSNMGRSGVFLIVIVGTMFLMLRGNGAAMAVGLGVMLTVGPALAIRTTVRTPLEVPVTPVELDASAPAWLGAYVRSVSDALKSEGFVPYGSFESRDGRITLLRTVFREPSTEIAALVLCAYQNAAPSLPVARYLGFFSNLADGRQRSTGNSTRPPTLPTTDDVVAERFAVVDDPARLYRVHSALMARDRKAEPKSYRTSGAFDAATFVREIEARARRNQLRLGYYCEDGDVVRPTWRGAFLMGWRQTPPVKQVLEWIASARARALLKELGV
jgi:hypothetical protein